MHDDTVLNLKQKLDQAFKAAGQYINDKITLSAIKSEIDLIKLYLDQNRPYKVKQSVKKLYDLSNLTLDMIVEKNKDKHPPFEKFLRFTIKPIVTLSNEYFTEQTLDETIAKQLIGLEDHKNSFTNFIQTRGEGRNPLHLSFIFQLHQTLSSAKNFLDSSHARIVSKQLGILYGTMSSQEYHKCSRIFDELWHSFKSEKVNINKNTDFFYKHYISPIIQTCERIIDENKNIVTSEETIATREEIRFAIADCAATTQTLSLSCNKNKILDALIDIAVFMRLKDTPREKITKAENNLYYALENEIRDCYLRMAPTPSRSGSLSFYDDMNKRRKTHEPDLIKLEELSKKADEILIQTRQLHITELQQAHAQPTTPGGKDLLGSR